MTFFTIECTKSLKSCFIKADSLDEILQKSIEKLKLPDGNYSVVMEDKKTEVDENVMEYASQGPHMKLFILINDDENNSMHENANKEKGKYLITCLYF